MPPYTIHYTSHKPLSASYGGGILLSTDVLDIAIGALAALATYKETEEPALLRKDSKRRYEVNFYAEDDGTLMYKFWVEGTGGLGKGKGDSGNGGGGGGVKSAPETEENQGRGEEGKMEGKMEEEVILDDA